MSHTHQPVSRNDGSLQFGDWWRPLTYIACQRHDLGGHIWPNTPIPSTPTHTKSELLMLHSQWCCGAKNHRINRNDMVIWLPSIIETQHPKGWLLYMTSTPTHFHNILAHFDECAWSASRHHALPGKWVHSALFVLVSYCLKSGNGVLMTNNYHDYAVTAITTAIIVQTHA